MYIFERIIQFIKGKTYKPNTRINFTPNDGEDLLENPDECEHVFMPLDSTNEFFACKYCGIVVNKKDLKQ